MRIQSERDRSEGATCTLCTSLEMKNRLSSGVVSAMERKEAL